MMEIVVCASTPPSAYTSIDPQVKHQKVDLGGVTFLLESEQGPLRNGSHVRALFQSQVGPVDLLRTRSIFLGVLF